MIETPAPDFAPGYPSGGERIGPAWRSLWAVLGDSGECWTEGRTLAETITEDHEITVKTASTLLYSAARVGLLEKRRLKVEGRGRSTVHYRISGKLKPHVKVESL